MKLTSSFHREMFKREVDSCTDMEKLKSVTRELIDSYFNAREMAEKMLLESLRIEELKLNKKESIK